MTIEPDATIQHIEFRRLVPWAGNPRHKPAADKVAALARSIGKDGLLQNLIARPHPKPNGHDVEVVAGQTRLAAVALLIKSKDHDHDKHTTLPVRVRDLTDVEALEIALSENSGEPLDALEEGEAYQRLKKAGRTVIDMEASLPVSKRHIETRLQIANNLTPAMKKAFRAGEINVLKAKTIAAFCPKSRQAHTLELIHRGVYGYASTAARLKQELLGDALPMENAIFGNPDKPLETFTDEEDGKVYTPERERFGRLQLEAIDQERKMLAKTYGWVRVIPPNEHFAEWEFEKGRGSKKNLGAVIQYGHDWKVKISRNWKPKEGQKSISGQADEARKLTGDAPPAPADPKKALPTKAGLAQAHRDKTRVLRRKIAGGSVETAIRLVCVALLQGTSYRSNTVRVDRIAALTEDERIEDPEVMAPCLDLRNAKSAWFRKGDPGRLTLNDEHGNERVQVQLYKHLDGMGRADLLALFRSLVAQNVGTWPQAGEAIGDPDLARHLAAEFDIRVTEDPDFAMTDTRQKAMTKIGLAAWAEALGLGPAADLIKRTAGKLREAVTAHLGEQPDARDTVPAAWTFGTEAAILKASQPKPVAKAPDKPAGKDEPADKESGK